MSLQFSFNDMKVEAKNNPNYCWQETEDGTQVAVVSQTIIFACMGVGIGRITENNVGEFYARMKVYYKLDGVGSLFENGEPRMITMEELADHIGLSTNVTTETRAQWARRIFVNKQTSYLESEMRYFNQWRGDKLAQELEIA